MRTYTITTDETLDAETDLILREYIIGLADECIAADDYKGPKARLANFLAGYVYQRTVADLRPQRLSAQHAAIFGLPEGTIV